MADVVSLDQYGRSLRFVYTAHGVLTDYEFVASGWTKAVFIGRNRLQEDELEDAADEAQRAGAGI